MAGIPPFFKLSQIPVTAASDSCSFSFITTLASPNIMTIPTLKPGETLQVRFPEPLNMVIAVTDNGDICGTIMSNMARIILCLKKGINFEAKIIKINGAECQVLIQNASA